MKRSVTIPSGLNGYMAEWFIGEDKGRQVGSRQSMTILRRTPMENDSEANDYLIILKQMITKNIIL